MLGMFVLCHETRYHLGGCRTNTFPPVDQARRRPFHVSTVGRRHMRGNRGEAALSAVTGMACDPLPTMHQLDHRRRHARFQHLADQRVRHAVAVAFDLDVVVDVHLDGLEVRHLVAL